ncbi:unnamed protein product [Cuscuta campestris]|uniref:Uncharacterized protein n=1 Tax=Cuscuta campestris TaxID=132261 RepID=A0A484M1B5_9ASTE|nr:unnamed protein product [Cuscuta campestris]
MIRSAFSSSSNVLICYSAIVNCADLFFCRHQSRRSTIIRRRRMFRSAHPQSPPPLSCLLRNCPIPLVACRLPLGPCLLKPLPK